MNARTLLATLALLFPVSAFAIEDVDTAAPGAPINPSERRGLTAGVAAGLGDIHVFPEEQDEIITEAKSGYFNAGYAVSQRFLVLGWGEYNSETGMTHSAFGGGGQVFLNDRFFVRGGVGIMRFRTGVSDPASGETESEADLDRWAMGGELAIGLEWFQFRDMAINSHLAYMGAFYPHSEQGDIGAYNVALRIGLQWYGL